MGLIWDSEVPPLGISSGRVVENAGRLPTPKEVSDSVVENVLGPAAESSLAKLSKNTMYVPFNPLILLLGVNSVGVVHTWT